MAENPDQEGGPMGTVFFREWREFRGFTQGQVEQALGWGQGRISKLEAGTLSSKPQTLADLARIYAAVSAICSSRRPMGSKAASIRAAGWPASGRCTGG